MHFVHSMAEQLQWKYIKKGFRVLCDLITEGQGMDAYNKVR